MGRRGGPIVLAALVATAGLATLATGGQAQTGIQAMTSTAEAEVVGQPDGVAGAYEVDVTVTTMVSGGTCTCRTSHVTLVVETPETVAVDGVDPATYEIDWTPGQGSHEQPVHVDLWAKDTLEEQATIHVKPRPHPPNPFVVTNANPTQVEIPPDEADLSPRASTAGSGSQATPTGADQTASVDGTEVDTGAALAAGALAVLGAGVVLTRQS